MATKKQISERFLKVANMMKDNVMYKTEVYHLYKYDLIDWATPNYEYFIASHMRAANELYKQLCNDKS